MRAGYDRVGREVSVKAAKRGCFEKKPFDNRNKARDWAARFANRHPEADALFPYKGGVCGRFHLTRQDRNAAKPMPQRARPSSAKHNPSALQLGKAKLTPRNDHGDQEEAPEASQQEAGKARQDALLKR